MYSSARVLMLSLCLLAVVAPPASPQGASRTLTPPADPFTITTGSSFSASGTGDAPAKENSTAVTRVSATIAEAEELIKSNYVDARRLTNAQMTKSSLDGALRSLDPHSNFYDPAEWKDLMDEQQSGYSGIGATIGTFERGGSIDTYILSTFPRSGAEKVQLRFGDRVVAINRESMVGKGSDFVRDRLRGPEGTTFSLTIERASTLRLETVEVRRSRVPQPSIPDAYIIRPTIGYVALSDGFNYTTTDEFDQVMRDLKRQGMRSLILDLRGNGGGIVDQAVKIAERFLPAGTLILTQRGRSRLDNRVWKSPNTAAETMPLVILVDENTASASEIVAGAFQDNDRALIVGERTFGKGLVQSVLELPGRTGLTLTTARYLTPSGRSIQRDYSKLDSYDYFNHKTSDEAAGAYFEARTITDRKVYGGDGILPDQVVKGAKPSSAELGLIDPFFFFTRELVNGRIKGQEVYRTANYLFGSRVSPAGLSDDASLLPAFHHYLNSSPSWTRLVPLAGNDLVALRVRYYRAMAEAGAVSAEQVLIEKDPQIAKAIDSLPLSGQLAQLASKLREQRK
jgi:carboxyl-terminal processing protease